MNIFLVGRVRLINEPLLKMAIYIMVRRMKLILNTQTNM